MPNTLPTPQRIGPNSRLIFYKEGTRGSDTGITAGHVMGLRDESGFQISRDEQEVPYFNGTSQGWATAPGPISAAGPIPLSMDFTNIGNYLVMPVGSSGYSNTALASQRLHTFAPPAGVTTPTTAQLQHEYLETTSIYTRARYAMLKSLALAYAQGGAAPLDLVFWATGDLVDTDLAGTKADNGIGGVSVFNGKAQLATAATARTWYTVQPTAFSLTWDLMLELLYGAFNDGAALGINQGVPKLSGNLELAMATGGSTPESDFTFRDYAKNRTVLAYRCTWADQTVSASPYPSAWLELEIASMRVGRRDARPGGRAGKRQGATWQHVFDSTYSKIPARAYGSPSLTVTGTWNIGATSNIFSVKFDGGATINVTLTQGAARTTDQIVAELNADGTFGAAGVADNHNGRVRVTSKQAGGTGTSSSVAFQTGTANHCGTVLGFTSTTFTGWNSPYVFMLHTAQSANY